MCARINSRDSVCRAEKGGTTKTADSIDTKNHIFLDSPLCTNDPGTRAASNRVCANATRAGHPTIEISWAVLGHSSAKVAPRWKPIRTFGEFYASRSWTVLQEAKSAKPDDSQAKPFSNRKKKDTKIKFLIESFLGGHRSIPTTYSPIKQSVGDLIGGPWS